MPGQSLDPSCYTDMSDEIFYKLEDLLCHAHTVTFGGVGEPTISRGFVERIQWIRELNPGIQIITFTNGSTLNNPQLIEGISRVVDYLHVSVNGLGKYEEVMVGGVLEKTLGNLKQLRDLRRRFGRPQRLELGVVLMRSNADELVQLAELARDLEFDRIVFKDLWVFDQKLKAESLRHDVELAERIRRGLVLARDVGIPMRCEPWPELSTPILRPGYFLKRAKDAFGVGHLWPTLPMINYWSRLLLGKLDKRIGFSRYWERGPVLTSSPTCRYPWDMVQVTERGEVLLCCEGLTGLGSIADKPFLDVWTGKVAADYRTGMKTDNYHGACRECKYINLESTAFVRENG